jgi:hypothetical protein
MLSLKIIISYGCDMDKKIVNLIGKKIYRSLKKVKKDFEPEIMIIRCHRKLSNTIFIQPVHSEMNLNISKCYTELINLYMQANSCKCLVNRFMSRVKLGEVKIKI